AAPIEVDAFRSDADDEDQRPLMIARSDFGNGTLEALAKVGRDVPYDAQRVALIDGRGKTVHGTDTSNNAAAETIRVLRLLLLACLRTGASDLHIEPRQTEGLVRFRVDGAMVEAVELPIALVNRLMSLVKIL